MIVALPGVAASAPQRDPKVEDAAAKVGDANANVEHIRNALDATARNYERANAHRIRLQDELVEADALVDRANDAVAQAEVALGDRVADAYKHPRGDMGMPSGLFDAPDASSALHRAALYRRLVASSIDTVDKARWTSELTTTDVRQGHIIAAGAEASVDEWKRQSRTLKDALRNAKVSVVDAQAGLDAAREQAAREAAEKARLEAQLATGAAPGGPVPTTNGRTCPVGTPNGFIDSWHFPRPGGRLHEGVDMFAPYGTPLYAAADGVIYRVYNNTIGGLSINLIDAAGNMYFYTHLSSASVESGQSVRVGEVIGAVGTSGNAAGTPPHLHWQFHPGNGEPINPYPLAYALCR